MTLDAQFCIEALNDALLIGKPEIFNSDQGSQYTSNDFTSTLLSQGILISMDGRGRVFDNIFIERLWRTLKYEEVYSKKRDATSKINMTPEREETKLKKGSFLS